MGVDLMKIEKSTGITSTERLLSGLCERTFLKLWSWPNLCKQDGNELCDLIAVFNDHVFVFFDRESRVIQDAKKDISITWPRWKKEVVDKQIKTAKGAEGYIRKGLPVYLDKRCQQPFPVTIPENPIIHKIIVAHGAADVCKSFSEDNVSGSLAVTYGDLKSGLGLPFSPPFLVELEKDSPIHVLDSSNLEILLRELDTCADFATYLNEKERAISKYDFLLYCGEEDLLAHYFLHYDDNGKRYRIGAEDENVNLLYIGEGEWKDFEEKGLAERRRIANKESYLWDDIIQKACQHALDGTLGGVSPLSPDNPVMEMAKEHRLSRRELSRIMIKAINSFPETNQPIVKQVCYMQSLSDPGKMYVLLQLKCPDANGDWNREKRRYLLDVACGVLRNQFPHIKTVVGIAIPPPKYTSQVAEDFRLLKCAEWSAEDRIYYDRENEKWNFFKNARLFAKRVVDFE